MMRGYFVIILFIFLGCNSTPKEAPIQQNKTYQFVSLLNPATEQMKQRLIDPTHQAQAAQLLTLPGKPCTVNVSDWSGKKHELFSLQESRLIEGSCLQGYVEGTATVSLDFSRHIDWQTPHGVTNDHQQGQALIKAEFIKGLPYGTVEIYEDSTANVYKLTQQNELQFQTKKTAFSIAEFSQGKLSGHKLTLLETQSPDENYGNPLISLLESHTYDNGLLVGNETVLTNGGQQSMVIPYIAGVVHGYILLTGLGTGFCVENGVTVKKMQEECGQ